jgi:hypothetical protein
MSLDQFVYPLIITRKLLSKHFPATTSNCRRHRFLSSPSPIRRNEVMSCSQNFLFLFLLKSRIHYSYHGGSAHCTVSVYTG